MLNEMYEKRRPCCDIITCLIKQIHGNSPSHSHETCCFAAIRISLSQLKPGITFIIKQCTKLEMHRRCFFSGTEADKP